VATELPWYLVDTNVLSNRSDAEGDPHVAEWLRRYARLVRVSVVTLAEMHRGLLLAEAKAAALTDRRAKARATAGLETKRRWFGEVTERFSDRVEPIDPGVALKWAEVSVRFPSLRDGDKALAATALAKGYGVATRNLGDFRRIGVPLVNPFDPATWDEGEDEDPVATLMRR
jgi:toxin FitB